MRRVAGTVDRPAAAEARDRKAEHLRLAMDPSMQVDRSFFDDYRLEHCALPELSLAEVDVGTEFLGRSLDAPLLISCMTGGTDRAGTINRRLAGAAETRRVAVGVGSQRKALEDPRQAASFLVRDQAPTVPLIANLGAVQLNYGFGLPECREAVSMIGADALALHLNPLQEALQPEGQGDFRNLYVQLGRIARELSVPVIAKEIGSGISAAVGGKLLEQGVRIVDTAGVGGTSWARIEAARAADPEIGELFADWGIPTPESVRGLAAVDGLTVIGSGGVRSGLDVAKALALGADLVGLAQPFLVAAEESQTTVEDAIERIVRELRITMFCTGCRTLEELRRAPIRRVQEGGV